LNVSYFNETIIGSRCSLRSPDQKMEPENGRIHFHREERYIHIDLQKTVKKVEEAYYFLREVAMNGQGVLFVGTKKQAQDSIREEAQRADQYYVNARWLGGMLTNFKTIKGRINRLKELTKMEEEGVFDVLPRKKLQNLELKRKNSKSILAESKK